MLYRFGLILKLNVRKSSISGLMPISHCYGLNKQTNKRHKTSKHVDFLCNTVFLLFVQALKVAHAGISLSEAEASVASPFTSKVLLDVFIQALSSGT